MTGSSVANPLSDDSLSTWIRAFLPEELHCRLASPDEALVRILDQCGAKAILLSAGFRRLLATRAAERLIRTGSPFQIIEERLICSLAPLEFRRAFLDAHRKRRSEVRLDVAATSFHLVLTLVPGRDGPPRVLVFVREHGGAGQPVSAARVRASLGLTSSEAALVAALTNGLSTRAYAESKGLSIHTVRNQLKTAYQKLDVHSQKDMAAAVLRHCGAAHTGGADLPSGRV